MKKILFCSVLLSMLVCSTATLFGQSIDLLKKLEQRSLHIAAHRGGHHEQPENSIPAIEEAIRLGASVVEVDVRATKDGVLVLMHDKTINRTTNGVGEVAKHTYAEIQQMHLRTSAGEGITPLTVPTLADVLQVCRGKILVDIDFKEERKEFIKKTYDLIAQQGMEDQVLFFLYDYKDMPAIYSLNPRITLFPRAHSMKELAAIMKLKMTTVIHLDESFTDTAQLNFLRMQGLFFWMNSLGEYDEKANLQGKDFYQSFVNRYPFVRLVQTDNPGLWAQFIAAQ